MAARPTVYVAEAETPTDARKLHRRIWNLGNVPFLLVRLPSEVRVYAGFRYEASSDEVILSGEINRRTATGEPKLADFSAVSIDSARIWQAQRQHLETKYRVDTTLLENLEHLAQALNRSIARQCWTWNSPTPLSGKFVYLRYLRDRISLMTVG